MQPNPRPVLDYEPAPDSAHPKRELGLFDSTSLIVGIIIGVAIYLMTPDIARAAGAAWAVPLIWIAGGLLSLCGALGYAELGTMFPQHEGGDYVYLTRAYGSWAGFLFGWVQLTVVRPGDIAVVAFGFGTYANELWPLPRFGIQIYAAISVIVFTAINILGVRQGKWAQNLLTLAKALGLLTVAAVAVFAPAPSRPAAPVPGFPLTVAMIFVLFAYGGWNEMAYIAAEVKNPRRNISRALVLGILAVTVIYVLVNLAFIRALGYDGLANSKAVASDAVATAFPDLAKRLISALICISALGAVNGLIFTGARISYAVGADHRPFAWMGQWNARTQTPIRALAVQGAIAFTLVVTLAGFGDAVLYTASCVYAFYLATSAAVIVLRIKLPRIERPYRATGYPVTTLIFCIACIYMLQGAIRFRPWVALGVAGIVLLGVPVYLLTKRKTAATPVAAPPRP